MLLVNLLSRWQNVRGTYSDLASTMHWLGKDDFCLLKYTSRQLFILICNFSVHNDSIWKKKRRKTNNKTQTYCCLFTLHTLLLILFFLAWPQCFFRKYYFCSVILAYFSTDSIVEWNITAVSAVLISMRQHCVMPFTIRTEQRGVSQWSC